MPSPTKASRTTVAKAAVASVSTPANHAPPVKAAPAPKVVKTTRPPGAEAARPDKPKKPKLVRDSFTIPKPEYAVIEALKLRAAKLGQPAKKSEVLRAGLKALAGLSDEALLASLAAVPRVKTGRPAKA